MSASTAISVKAFEYDESTHELKILNQKELPTRIVYNTITSTDEGRDHVLHMTVRGAPCIAAVYILSMVAELNHIQKSKISSWTIEDLLRFYHESHKKIYNVRPTAVNLYNALSRLKKFIEIELENENSTMDHKISKLTAFCIGAIDAGTNVNERIGKFGSEEIVTVLKAKLNKGDDKFRLLTHCNTGSLATTSYGTALGVVRSLHKSGHLERCYCTETRPYNQGSRLTAWELVQEKIPATLIVDSSVAYLMQQGKVDAVVVGADCVARNGDTANKIGTYQLAVLANHANIPFYIAAPFQSIDLNRESGQVIKVECRPADEVRKLANIQLAPNEIDVWNPSFDVTPADLITGIVTEYGVTKPAEINKFKLDHLKEMESDPSIF